MVKNMHKGVTHGVPGVSLFCLETGTVVLPVIDTKPPAIDMELPVIDTKPPVIEGENPAGTNLL
ncbi:hypothetical protein [Bacillus sp. SJS]|uniref:hypothetical protein n=1 Tax=Bacillus sp. SJS TaxID=1423321 RepID=UPI0004DCD1C8|nr:hypothetical protein [Bacillus sp. SJS]KZZ85327.1 hypothetical protein AS29_006000 [Bacillus sp. SJS]